MRSGRKLWMAGALAALMALVGLSPCLAAQAKKEVAALEAARAWLELTDGGKYEESWEAAGAYFRQQVTREQWVEALEQVRRPLGDVVERKVRGTQYTNTLPNAPEGEYVVIQFDTRFAGKDSTRELVTPVQEEDGTWRVVGYFLQ